MLMLKGNESLPVYKVCVCNQMIVWMQTTSCGQSAFNLEYKLSIVFSLVCIFYGW